MGRPGARAGLLLLAGLAAGCGAPQERGEPALEVRDESLEARLRQSPEWIDVHVPDRTHPGVHLALFNRRIPFLMDMNGQVVHTWPDVRASGRARLLPTGHLVVITDRGHLEEYDWEGERTWSFEPEQTGHMLHHDFAPLENGGHLLLVHRPRQASDDLVEVNREGQVVWRWSSREAIAEDFGRSRRPNKTHMNSIQALPSNRWFDAGHEAFRPGNVLVSARNLDTLYIVSRPEGEVVWRYTGELDWQHEARMTPAGYPSEGEILLFNNRYHSEERESALVGLDPVEETVTWSYQAPGFFSATEGTQQVLPNGNLLVTSSHGGRVFELTRDRRIVWQWVPPYPPVRVARYGLDHAPQLEALEIGPGRPVQRHDPESYVDTDQYSFALHDVRHVPAGESTIVVLRERNQCRTLRLPDRSSMTVGYGVDHRQPCDDGVARPVEFGVTVRPLGSTSEETLLRREVTLSDFEELEAEGPFSLRREELPLDRFGARVEVCVSLTASSEGRLPACYVWQQPEIRPPGRPEAKPFDEERSAEVQEYERRQLEAMGYIN